MIPIPMHTVLVGVAAFVGFLTCCAVLAKLAIWWAGELVRLAGVKGGTGGEMRRRAYLLAAVFAGLAISGCGGGGGGGKCASPYTGLWIGTTTTDQIILSENCDYQ